MKLARDLFIFNNCSIFHILILFFLRLLNLSVSELFLLRSFKKKCGSFFAPHFEERVPKGAYNKVEFMMIFNFSHKTFEKIEFKTHMEPSINSLGRIINPKITQVSNF